MTRAAQHVQEKYDVLLFAKTPEAARKAAREFAVAVLGEEASKLPVREALRESCRRWRPAADPKEQQRFEDELVELAFGAEKPHSAVAA
jgi:hypothetical protein